MPSSNSIVGGYNPSVGISVDDIVRETELAVDNSL